MRAGDDDVDLARALADRIADLVEPLRQRRQAGRKAGRDGGDRNAGALERLRPPGRPWSDRRRPRRPSAARRQGRARRGGRRDSGRRALAQSRRTRPGVSSPASVVRSMQVTAFTSQAAWYSFLTERRVVSVAARRSTRARLTSIVSNQSSVERRALVARMTVVPSITARVEPFGTTLSTDAPAFALVFASAAAACRSYP